MPMAFAGILLVRALLGPGGHMKLKSIVAALVMVTDLGTGLATVTSATAHADPIDQIFVQILGEKGLRLKPGVDAVASAHSTCDLLAGGATPTETLKKVRSATGLSVQDSTTFAGLAIYGYCKQYMPK